FSSVSLSSSDYSTAERGTEWSPNFHFSAHRDPITLLVSASINVVVFLFRSDLTMKRSLGAPISSVMEMSTVNWANRRGYSGSQRNLKQTQSQVIRGSLPSRTFSHNNQNHHTGHRHEWTLRRSRYSLNNTNMDVSWGPSETKRFLRTQKVVKPFVCSKCGRRFCSRRNLLTHQRIHKGRSFVCSKCGKCFSHQKMLIAHKLVHTGRKPFTCTECNKESTLVDTTELNAHLQTHREKPLLCNETGQSCGNKSKLKADRGISTGQKPLLCTECGKAFTSKRALKVHLRVHAEPRPFVCTECGKSFKAKCKLNVHLRIHTGEQRYVCTECGKCFRDRFGLNEHHRIHTGEKPFICTECGKSFCRKTHLDRQLTLHFQTHTGEKPFDCSECGKRFRVKCQLTLHLQIHTGEKPFVCTECGKSFRVQGKLTVHLQTHTGEKPFDCSECGKSFRVKSQLNLHLQTHTGEKPFDCSECGKSFRVKHQLTLHLQTHTGEKPFDCSECGKIPLVCRRTAIKIFCPPFQRESGARH
uniref:C2H2-type domain-containing protein n=1 Tax=Xenopus tropicalis TaxID=8364 RepID=A0A803K114_XENTR